MRNSRWLRLLALLLGLSMVAAACGDDDDDAGTSGDDETEDTDGSDDEGGDDEDETGDEDDEDAAGTGGELINFGTFVGDPPEHIDPALSVTLNAYQVISSLYDGLTDLDFSSGSPEVKPHLAESAEPNEDGSVWTFTIKEGQAFSNGEEILPSTFKRSWERAAALAGDYSYLIGAFLEGGQAALDGETTDISGVVADDEAMTLEVTLTEPYANFDAVVTFQLFFPMPEEAGDGTAPVADYENGIMIGNGPYAMESARSDEEIVLVKSDAWVGDVNGETWDGRLDRIIFGVQADPDTSYNALEAGEAQVANIPSGRYADAEENYGTTSDVGQLGSYHFVLNNQDGALLGGDENIKLRQAISSAINRDEINTAVYNDTRTVSTGVTPEGIPGWVEGICEICVYDPEQAETLFGEWQAEGGTLDGPIPLSFNSGAGHEDVIQIMVDNLAAVGIEAEADPQPTETYFSAMAENLCEAVCRAGWFADYPTYDNFMYDLFHSDTLNGNNFGYSNDEFDSLISEAKTTTDGDAAAQLFQDAERILLNTDPGAIPIVWYTGTYVYDDEIVDNFIQTNQGLVLWEQITLKG